MYNEIKRKEYKSDLRQSDLNYSQGTKRCHLWTQAKTTRKQLDKMETMLRYQRDNYYRAHIPQYFFENQYFFRYRF